MISFRPAVRSNVVLMIGLAGGTGSGKTFTAMRLASGMAEGKRFAVIDTENGRASHYADQFDFDVAELRAPFSPDAYAEAIMAAEKAGYPVIVVDSMSHEYAGDGGILDMQEAEFQRMGGRDGVKMASWIKPKMAHKDMVTKLLQVRAHLILCFRAEQKIDIQKDAQGKTQIVPKQSLVGLDGWIPITEKSLPFEATVSFLFTADRPGVPKAIKLQEQHRALFPLDQPITEESGRLVAQWASGGHAPESPATGILDRVAAAATVDDLAAVHADANARKAELTAEERAQVTTAIRTRKAVLAEPPAAAAGVTFDQVSGKLHSAARAKDADLLDAHATLIATAPESDREQLTELYHSLRNDLVPA